MGNTSTKEQRSPHPILRSSHNRSLSSPHIPGSPTSPPTDNTPNVIYSSRNGRGSRSEFSSLLGIGSSGERNGDGLDSRKETKQEREARKLEKERVSRAKERDRSMREESVDGGYLVTQGVYTGMEDYNKAVVRQLMIERRIAPFWRGLNEHSSSWTENQLVAAARGLPIPAPDEIPQESPRSFPMNDSNPRTSNTILNTLTIPISSRSASFNSDSSSNLSPTQPNMFLPSPTSTASTLLRGRAKTLATLTTLSKTTPQPELTPREMNLPKDPYVNGQPIEAYLYKDASECPICFLYYPPYLNSTRCCDQDICSECFVQIKRPDPHPPEHSDPSAPPTAVSETPGLSSLEPDAGLVSEPAACPFCVQPDFGITYESPHFRRGLTYVNQLSTNSVAQATSAMSSSSSLGSSLGIGAQVSASGVARRRTTSMSANSPSVITTDRIRPDWATKLSNARAHAARRSAAATALHTAAYLMGNRNGSPDTRGFGGLGRRTMLRRATGGENSAGGASASQLNMLALLSERLAVAGSGRGESSAQGENSLTSDSPRASSRRSRMEDLEDMMLMEAIRLSLASEDERRKREEKEAKKDAKKKSKEEKKAEKAARKAGPYPSSSNQSSSTLESPKSTSYPWDNGKGKSAQLDVPGRDTEGDLSTMLSTSAPFGSSTSDHAYTQADRSKVQMFSTDVPSLYGSSTYKPSHLRTLSNVSSSTSSIDDSTNSSHNIAVSSTPIEASPSACGISTGHHGMHETSGSTTPAGEVTGMEPTFNFRSLAAMIVDDGMGDEFQDTVDAATADRDANPQPQAKGMPRIDSNKPKRQYHDVLGHNDLLGDTERPVQRSIQSKESVKVEDVRQEC